jgi:hypothetical protein
MSGGMHEWGECAVLMTCASVKPCAGGGGFSNVVDLSIFCAAGLFYVVGSASASWCAPCPAGTFSLAGSTSCTACDAGRFKPSAGSSSCFSCSPGTAALAKQIALSASLARTTPRPEARLFSPASAVMPGRSTPRPEAARYHPACLVTLGRTVPPLLLCSAHLALLALTAPTSVPYKDFRAMRATSALQDHPPRPRARQAASVCVVCSFCQANAGAPLPCPQNTYGESGKLSSETQCTPCAPGKESGSGAVACSSPCIPSPWNVQAFQCYSTEGKVVVVLT